LIGLIFFGVFRLDGVPILTNIKMLTSHKSGPNPGI
jgi:hypothetical protein